MDERFSRRAVLGAAAGVAGAVAGCSLPRPSVTGDRIDVGGAPATEATTQFRGGLRRQGVYPDRTVPTDVETAWTVPEVNTGDHTAAKASPVALPGGDLLIPGDAGDLCRVTPDGDVAWTADVTDASRGMHGTPAVANGTAYIGAYDGALSAIDLETGDRFWRAALGDAIGSSPAYYDGTVYIAVEYSDPSGAMFAVDAVDGAVEWDDQRVTDHPHSTCAIDREAGRLVVGSNDGNLYAWSFPDLEFLWTFETGAAIKGPVAVADGSAFLGSWGERLYRVALEDGSEEWAFDAGNEVMTGPSVEAATGTVYFGDHDGDLYALELASGEETWRFGTEGRLIGCPTVTSEHVLVGSHDTRLYCVEKDSGRAVWRVEAAGTVSSTPLVREGAIYFADRASEDYLADGDGETGAFRKLVAVE
ncbi:MAG: PQQ-binding-like beta-propeller repeat protein [Haloarculaceae archaeon]